MTKLAFICFQKPDLLWVHVLQGKYLKDSTDGLIPAHRSSQSNIWRGICHAWPCMMAGARAGVRDGQLTSFWESKWLDSGIILGNWAAVAEPEFNPLDRVADFVIGDEGWDLEKLNKLLPSDIVEQVVGRSPPRDDLGPDIWVWGYNHDGRFTVKSAYNMITAQNAPRTGINWDKVWKWEGPYRIKSFLWLAVHGRLLTNSERVRRHLATSAACPRCGAASESVAHALRDCPLAADSWNHTGFDGSDRVWRGPVADWVMNGLLSAKGLLFGVTAWMIWKNRNEVIFSNSSASGLQTAQRSINWANTITEAFQHENRCFGPQGLKRWENIAWEPGPADWVTINTDGSCLASIRKASAGGIIRRADGRGLVAFTMNLGACTVTRAEIRGAIGGLELAWDYGFRRVELQLDSKVVVSMLLSSEEPEHQQAAEVLHFRNLCKRSWEVRIRHIFREANKAADFLANHRYNFPFGIHLFPLSDCNLGHILRYDCLNISEPRLITVMN
ncbi:Putative ribonuclease H protein At1g65750 [Linum perenne]